MGGGYMNDFYAREFWRFVPGAAAGGSAGANGRRLSPMQAPASFNLEAVKAQVQEMMQHHEGRREKRLHPLCPRCRSTWQRGPSF